MKRTSTLGAILVVAVCGIALAIADDTFQGMNVKVPFDRATHGAPAKPTTSNQIIFHAPPVMNAINSVYAIYYGSFPTSTEPIMNDFLAGLSYSTPPIYSVNTTYNGGPGTPSIPPTFGFDASGSVYQDLQYSQGTQLGSSSIPKIVANAIKHGLKADANGVYLVMTDPTVKISGFCNSFCAYHTKADIQLSNGATLHFRYALIPDPTQRCSACNGGIAVYGDTVTPNGDMGADTMADDIIHELSETVTDPDITAWYTQNGAENGDLCNYVYGTPMTGSTSTGGIYHYNVTVPSATGSRLFLIQQIWKNNGTLPGACASSPTQ
jgi:hypothetical protein